MCITKGARLFVSLCLVPAIVSPALTEEAALFPHSMEKVDGLSRYFITSVTLDRRGGLWVGTEENGVFRVDGQVEKHRCFGCDEGLGDDCIYALTLDGKGRVWAGHLNHGVSVYNGRQWRNYSVYKGPLGERVFDLARQPVTGDMWIATSIGITRYRLQEDAWVHYTRLDGLSSDQVTCLAFGPSGKTVCAGTDCSGINVGRISAGAVRWRRVSAGNEVPVEPRGQGLPSDQVNDIVISPKGRIFVGTNSGLAIGNVSGTHWRYCRGKDYLEKIKNMYVPPIPSIMKKRKRLQGLVKKYDKEKLLLEDRITSLALDDGGLLWIGHWQKGYEVMDVSRGVIVEAFDPGRVEKKGVPAWNGRFFVKTIRPLGPGKAAVGWYPGGVTVEKAPVPSPRTKKIAVDELTEARDGVPFPSPAGVPEEETLSELARRFRKRLLARGSAEYLGDDWITRGDWVGRYGRTCGTLCAVQSPHDYDFCSNDNGISRKEYDITECIGPHRRKGDSLRNWIHWLSTDDGRTLYDSQIGVRRQASWDDHGETYPWTYEGPDNLVKIQIGPGLHRLGLYFFNKDGHRGNNRHRDYIIDIKSFNEEPGKQYFPTWTSRRLGKNTFVSSYRAARDLPVKPYFNPCLARARVHDFRGGVYKNFLLNGPAMYIVHQKRNYSFNTILSGVFIDRISSTLRDGSKNRRSMATPGGIWGSISYGPPAWRKAVEQCNGRIGAAVDLWNTAMVPGDNIIPNEALGRIAFRAAVADDGPPPVLKAWRWHLHIWNQKDRIEFMHVMNQSWENFKKWNSKTIKEHAGPHKYPQVPFPGIAKDGEKRVTNVSVKGEQQ